MARRILKAFGVEGAVAPETLLSASDALRAWLEARYPGATWYREWPVRARLAGDPPRLLVGEVDLFLELPDGFVLVDHKSFPGSEKERDRRLVEEYAPQLGWYARVLAQALRKPLEGRAHPPADPRGDGGGRGCRREAAATLTEGWGLAG